MYGKKTENFYSFILLQRSTSCQKFEKIYKRRLRPNDKIVLKNRIFFSFWKIRNFLKNNFKGGVVTLNLETIAPSDKCLITFW